jgi:hypothetical protein
MVRHRVELDLDPNQGKKKRHLHEREIKKKGSEHGIVPQASGLETTLNPVGFAPP